MSRDCIKIFASIVLFLFCNVTFALPFNIVTKAGTQLPTTVAQGSSAFAYYTVSNNTVAQRNNNFVKFLPPNTSQILTGTGVCGASFNLAGKGQAGDSCTLALQITGAIDAKDPIVSHHLFVCFPGGMSCAGSRDQLNVQQTGPSPLVSISITPTIVSLTPGDTQQFTAIGTYADASTRNITSQVTWSSSVPSSSSIVAGGLATSLMPLTTNITATLNSIVSNSAVITTTSAVYLGNLFNSGIFSCLVNADGSVNTCTGTGPGGVTPRAVALNPDGTHLYYIDGGGPTVVNNCPASKGIVSSGCTTTGIFTNANGIVINSQNTYAYIIDGAPANLVSYCAVNATTGDLSSCVTTAILSSTPLSIALTPDDSAAYLTDQSNQVYYCPINSTTHAIIACNLLANVFSGITGITINPAGTFAYIAGGSGGIGHVYACAILGDGTLQNPCIDTGSNMGTNAFAVALNYPGTYAYATTSGTNITICQVNNDGSLSNCVVDPGTFGNYGIAIH